MTVLLLLVCGALIGGYFYVDSLAYKKVNLEAGVELSASELMKNQDPDASFTEDSDVLDVTKPGEYEMKVRSGWFTHKVTVTVQDTVAPVISVWNAVMEYGQEAEPEDFIEEVIDATEVEITFASQPDFKALGEQTVTLLAVDAGGNEVTADAVLTVLPFTTFLSGEAGGKKPTAESFRLTDGAYQCESGLNAIDMKKTGIYNLVFTFEEKEYDIAYEVTDTTAPEAEFADYEGFVGENIDASYFVVSANDITSLTYSLDREIEQKEGTEEYQVTVTDEGGNAVSGTCMLTLQEDNEPPVVSVSGDIEVYEGNSVSYLSHISVSDNCAKDIDIQVECDNVDTSAAGTYPITYTVTDVGGNTVQVSSNVIVKERTYSMDEVNARADEILAEILEPDMTDYEKSWQIFNYVKTHVVFQDKSDKSSYVKACYEGIIENHGDCYVYACACQTLLTRAGIKNMMIERIPTKTTHFWNLVDYGEGWYHMDTTPRVPDHPTVFMWTEAQIQEYSAAHYRCYNYDHDEYPETN